jgi:hypothetical protein
MGRSFAGTLGPLACGMILTRGLVHGAGTEDTILAACGGLFVFALIGYVAGQLADQFVRESVAAQFQAALAAWEKQNNQPKTTSSSP